MWVCLFCSTCHNSVRFYRRCNQVWGVLKSLQNLCSFSVSLNYSKNQKFILRNGSLGKGHSIDCKVGIVTLVWLLGVDPIHAIHKSHQWRGAQGARGWACNGQRRWWLDPSRAGAWRGDVDSGGSEWTHLGDCWAEPNNRKRKTKGDSWGHPSPRVLTLLWISLLLLFSWPVAFSLRVHGSGKVHGGQACLPIRLSMLRKKSSLWIIAKVLKRKG